MKLVVGLGNPGSAYQDTRHNLGFMAADSLLKDLNAGLRLDSRNSCLKARLEFQGTPFILCKPLTYMNLSGLAVAGLSRSHKVDLENILVICDDASLDLGRIRIKARGRSAGHKGIESVIERLGSDNFARLRIGIRTLPQAEALSEFVLARFSSEEYKVVRTSLSRAREAVLCWLKEGTGAAMNKFN